MSLTAITPPVCNDEITRHLCSLTEAIYNAGHGEPDGAGFGGLFGYGCDFENEVFEMRKHTENPPDCTCGAQEVDGNCRCAPTCPFNLPNFKCDAFEVRWHKWCGRSQEVEFGGLNAAQVIEMFERCERSLKP